ncbi:MAG TPA: hypothetical protein VEL51_12955 [Vicinamibacterales bacterium]|nr:hypothetical protein [Vicinamibacterales bacterium]
MVPVLALALLLVQPPVAQPYRDDTVASAALGRTMKYRVLYLDCGTSDSLLEESRELVAILQKRGFAYEYHELPGAHTWDYWNRRIEAFLPWIMQAFNLAAAP